MPQYRLPEMSIAQMQYTPATFQGVSFTPQARDMNILARSLAQAEERHEKATEKQTAIDIALGEVEDKLNSAELPWFNEYKQNIQQQIQNEIDNGNYSSAIRVANRLAGKVASDTQLKNRIKQNANYQEALKTVKSNPNLSKDTKDWWIATHLYSYNDEQGVTEYNDMPAAPVDYVSLSAKAIQLAAPEKYSKDNEISNPEGIKGSTQSSTGSRKIQNRHKISEIKLTEEKLKEVMNGVFKGTLGGKEAVIQDRKVSLWKFNKLKEEQDNPNTTPERKKEIESEIKLYEDDLYDEGILMGEDEYIAKKVSPILHNAAYHYKETVNSNVYSGPTLYNNPGFNPTIPGMPKGMQIPFRFSSGGLINVPWSDYGQKAKTEAANAAKEAWNNIQ